MGISVEGVVQSWPKKTSHRNVVLVKNHYIISFALQSSLMKLESVCCASQALGSYSRFKIKLQFSFK